MCARLPYLDDDLIRLLLGERQGHLLDDIQTAMLGDSDSLNSAWKWHALLTCEPLGCIYEMDRETTELAPLNAT